MNIARISILAALFGFAAGAVAQTPTLSQQSTLKTGNSTRIEFATTTDAMEILRGRENVRVSKEYGWTIIEDRDANAVWSFTPEKHPAHPTMVKRTLIDHGRAVEIVMDGQCEADYEACEKVMAEMKRRTFRYQSMLGGHGPRMGGAAMADLPALQGLMQMSRSVN